MRFDKNDVKVAILSKNKILADFFGLEAESLGYSVKLIDKGAADLSAFDLCIIDMDTMKSVSGIMSKRTLLVSKESNISIPSFLGTDSEFISWPASVEKLRRIYEELLFEKKTEKNESGVRQKQDESVIYFYRERKNIIRYRDRNIRLSDYEARLLEMLCSNRGEAVSREAINTVFDTQTGNIADVYICHLRKKLEDPFGKRIIFTVRSKGYRITTDMEWE